MAIQRKNKSSFLLSKAISLPLINGNSEYDSYMNLNLTIVGKRKFPTVLLEGIKTESKTLAAPGDDDPDAESENCY